MFHKELYVLLTNYHETWHSDHELIGIALSSKEEADKFISDNTIVVPIIVFDTAEEVKKYWEEKYNARKN